MNLEYESKRRLWKFQNKFSDTNGKPLSIKIRVKGGCFHRQHSPNAYELIDNYLNSLEHPTFDFEEHESGPELLTYLKAGADIVTILMGILAVINVILKSRSDGIKKGDNPDAPLELIVRDFNGEKKLLEVRANEPIDKELIKNALIEGVSKLSQKTITLKKPSNSIKITSDYRITIPKEVRESLHLKTGQKLSFTARNGVITIVPIEIKK